MAYNKVQVIESNLTGPGMKTALLMMSRSIMFVVCYEPIKLYREKLVIKKWGHRGNWRREQRGISSVP